jgi:uridine phosphorylase
MEKREYNTWITYLNDKPILVSSTGIGAPSLAIAVEEFATLGVKTFLRVGTSGAIQPQIHVGDVVITTGGVRMEGASSHYAPIEYPAVAHHEVLLALLESAKQSNVTYHVGVTCSSDTFYPGQERYDSYTKYVPRRFQGITEEWRQLHVLNYEMEAATLLVLGSVMGLRAGCVCGVVVNRTRSEQINPELVATAEEHAIRVALGAVARL